MSSASTFARLCRLLGGLVAIACVAPATTAIAAACPAEPRAADVAAQWRQAQPIAALDVVGEDNARCFRKAFLAALGPQLGERVGYKVGMFSLAARRAFGIDRPRFGELYSRMLLPEGQSIPADFAVGGVWESDLLLVVGDERINTATTREEAYSGLSGFRPFIELTSRNYAADVKPTADQIAALDVGARLGVAGPEYPLAQTAEGMAALVNLSVEAVVSGAGEERLDHAVARETLGDLLDIVLFARDAVLQEGGRLHPGDLISVGVFTPARTPKPGQIISIRYHLLAQPVTVSTAFH